MTEAAADPVRRTAHRTSEALGYGVLLKTLRYVLAVGSHVAIRRVLGPEAFGQYSVAQAFVDIAAVVASLGMGQAILRFVPEAVLGVDPTRTATLVRRSVFVQIAGWITCLALVWGGRGWLHTWFRTDASQSLVILGTALLVFRLLFDLGSTVWNAVLAARALALLTLFWQVAFVVALALVLRAGWGAEGVLLAGAIANALGTVAMALAWRRRPPSVGTRVIGELPWARLLRYALPFAAINVCYNLVWRNSEAFWINYFWNERLVGFFSAGYNLSQLVLDFVPTAIWPLVMASYSTVFTLDRTRALRLVSHYYKLLFLVAAPLSIAGAVLGDRLLVVMYGPEFAEGGGLARLFFLVQCVSFLGTPLSMTLYVLEKTWVNLLVWIGAAVLNVGLNVVLIPIDWRLGSVLPVALAVAIMPIVYLLVLRKLDVRVSVPWRFLGRVYLASAFLLVLLPLRPWVHGAPALLASALAGALFFAFGLKVVRIFRAEERPLLELIPSAALRARLAWFGEDLR